MSKSIKTFLKSAAKDYTTRSVNPPVVRASTILFKTMQELRKHQKILLRAKKLLIGIMADKEAKPQFNYKIYLKN